MSDEKKVAIMRVADIGALSEFLGFTELGKVDAGLQPVPMDVKVQLTLRDNCAIMQGKAAMARLHVLSGLRTSKKRKVGQLFEGCQYVPLAALHRHHYPGVVEAVVKALVDGGFDELIACEYRHGEIVGTRTIEGNMVLNIQDGLLIGGQIDWQMKRWKISTPAEE